MISLPLNIPDTPAFSRQPFEHTITEMIPKVVFDDIYTLNTQSGTQWDGFRHVSPHEWPHEAPFLSSKVRLLINFAS